MVENDIKKLTEEVLAFTRDRDWDQFHNPKDLAIALSIEASELLEAFLWKKPEDAKMEKVREELADVVNYALLLADKCNLDIYEIVSEKLKVNGEKYPVEKSKGSAKKYSEF
jgi:NTP pyrophosphatase (non-canonical NTP hydrolase)